MNNNIIVFDIDDTLLKTDSPVVKIYKDTGESEILSSNDFAEDPDVDNPNVVWDFSKFNSPEEIYKVMTSGKPLIRNLRIMDRYAAEGYTIAFLTARAQEDAIYKALLKVIKIKDNDGQLQPIIDKLSREDSTAVNDAKYDKVFKGLTTAERKAFVLKYLCTEYDNVIFVDDDRKNLKAAWDLRLPNLKTITAQREILKTKSNLYEFNATNATLASSLAKDLSKKKYIKDLLKSKVFDEDRLLDLQ